MLSTVASLVLLDDVLHVIIGEEPGFGGGPRLHDDLFPSFGVGRHYGK